jgi:hypothetical protein
MAQVISVYIPEYQLKDSKWTFTIQFQLESSNFVLYRSFTEIYDFHVQLLKRHKELGINRLLPFLPKPVEMDAKEANDRRDFLATYFERISSIDSISDQVFFVLRKEDIDPTQKITFDSSDALLDLIENLEKEPIVLVTLIFENQEFQWKESPTTSYSRFINSVEDYLQAFVDQVVYKDELNEMITIGPDTLPMLFQLPQVTLYLY